MAKRKKNVETRTVLIGAGVVLGVGALAYLGYQYMKPAKPAKKNGVDKTVLEAAAKAVSKAEKEKAAARAAARALAKKQREDAAKAAAAQAIVRARALANAEEAQAKAQASEEEAAEHTVEAMAVWVVFWSSLEGFQRETLDERVVGRSAQATEAVENDDADAFFVAARFIDNFLEERESLRDSIATLLNAEQEDLLADVFAYIRQAEDALEEAEKHTAKAAEYLEAAEALS